MEIVYTGEEIPIKINKSIFAAGPSLRPGQENEMVSWRNDLIKILEDKGYDGVLFIPENRDGKFLDNFDYDDQVEWEHKCLNVADCILFWVPRDLSLDKNNNPKLGAFTTNVEWGAWADSGKVVFGCPPNVKEAKNTYLKYYADFYKAYGGDSLISTINTALDKVKNGAYREGGERFVPLYIWNTPSFQSWHSSQTEAGNRLDHAEVLWNYRPNNSNFVFVWALKVKIYIASEDRFKDNEFVLARTDVSSVCLYCEREPIEDTEVVLVKEFRSCAATSDGFIRELIGGSSTSDASPVEVAAEEVFEETGFHINSKRLVQHASRQVAGTFAAHKSHLFSARITEDELKWFKAQDGVVHGKEEDSERTFIEVYTVKDLLNNNLVDWSNLGQILAIIT